MGRESNTNLIIKIILSVVLIINLNYKYLGEIDDSKEGHILL